MIQVITRVTSYLHSRRRRRQFRTHRMKNKRRRPVHQAKKKMPMYVRRDMQSASWNICANAKCLPFCGKNYFAFSLKTSGNLLLEYKNWQMFQVAG